MGVLFNREYLQASSLNLAGDLSQYGSSAQWRGIYSRGDKIGFVVSQTVPRDDGYELLEDGRLRMSLLGATTTARTHFSARVDKGFVLHSFAFSLDPGTGAIEVSGVIAGKELQLTIKTPSGSRSDTRTLQETPALSMNLPRLLAAAGLTPGQHIQVSMFDPATLRNAPMTIDVQAREIVRAADRPIPAFRVQTHFSGITSTSWVTDTGEVVREESPTGLMVVRETRDQALAQAVPGQIQTDLMESAAIAPTPARRIDDPTTVERLRVRFKGAEIELGPDVQGGGQTVVDGVFEVLDQAKAKPGRADPEARQFLAAEPFLESDAPEIIAEARKAIQEARTPRAQAEQLVRHVNALLEKKPTVSLPSALEVLRTRVGDCNEHTALYVAMARSLGIPARIAVGLVYLRGAFYYHAWSEVWVQEPDGRGLWLPADPTLNQFPADATHIRLARGGLDRQASILPLMGHVRIEILDLDLQPGATPVLVGRSAQDTRPLDIPLPRRDGSGARCWSSPQR